MKERHRIFIALDLPEACKNFLKKEQASLKKFGADVRWVNPDNLHCTLKFFGELKAHRLKDILHAWERISDFQGPCPVRLSCWGGFPHLRRPRVLWIGFDTCPQLVQLHQHVETVCASLGFPKEDKPFQPHLTLGRVRSQKGINPLLETLTTRPLPESPSFLLDTLLLMESTLTPQGPVYAPLKKADLKP